jgi:hypothetical protein
LADDEPQADLMLKGSWAILFGRRRDGNTVEARQEVPSKIAFLYRDEFAIS